MPPAPADELATQPPYSPVTTRPMWPAEEPVTYPTIRVTGFFQLDTAYFNQDPLNKATVGDIDNGTAFRRTRIAATGNVTEDTSYLLEFDFAQAAPRFADIGSTSMTCRSSAGFASAAFASPLECLH